jgi:hypothetical protein
MKVIREFQKEPKDDTITIVEEGKPKITFSIEQAAECERQMRRALQDIQGGT